MSLNFFRNKVVLITGASSGIGKATSVYLAKLGAQVVVTGRDTDRLHSSALNCDQNSSLGLKALEVRADLDNESDAKHLIDSIINKFGRLDVLVNNAAAFDCNSNIESNDSLQVYDNVMKTNLRNSVQLTHYAVPHLIQSKGSIVNVSSVSSFKPFGGSMAHCIAKSGIDMFTRCLAYDLGPKGVRVNSVNPAQIKTPVYKTFGMKDEEIDQMWEKVRENYPLRRPGEPEDVAKAIAYLASDDASFATGVNLKLDGGFCDSLQFIF